MAANENMSSTPDSHCCAKNHAGIPAGILQLAGRFQESFVQCPAVPAQKGTVAVLGRRPFGYTYMIHVYKYICAHINVCVSYFIWGLEHAGAFVQSP